MKACVLHRGIKQTCKLMSVQAALRAALQGLEMCGSDERDPPEGSMTLALMRHQRLALDWMLRREAGSAVPTGGILADDQGMASHWMPY